MIATRIEINFYIRLKTHTLSPEMNAFSGLNEGESEHSPHRSASSLGETFAFGAYAYLGADVKIFLRGLFLMAKFTPGYEVMHRYVHTQLVNVNKAASFTAN
jgi:hypothetical protein